MDEVTTSGAARRARGPRPAARDYPMLLTLGTYLAEGSCGHLPFNGLIEGAVFTPITGAQKLIFFACGAGRGAFIGSAPGRETLTDPPVKCTL